MSGQLWYPAKFVGEYTEYLADAPARVFLGRGGDVVAGQLFSRDLVLLPIVHPFYLLPAPFMMFLEFMSCHGHLVPHWVNSIFSLRHWNSLGGLLSGVSEWFLLL